MEVFHDTVHHGKWQRYTIPGEDTTVGNLVRHHLLPFAHFVSCNMRHPLELQELQLCIEATPPSGKAETDRVLQQACDDAIIELTQLQDALAVPKISPGPGAAPDSRKTPGGPRGAGGAHPARK